MAFAGEEQVGRQVYLVTSDGLYVRKSELRLAAPATRPEGVAAWERWIDVDLERQLLVAYEGDVAVYATLVSSGKRGTAEESFLTPKGSYRITAKHVSSSMDGNAASDGRYSIQDVPWAMFFSGNYALHGAFWHQQIRRAAQPRLREPRAERRALAVLVDHAVCAGGLARGERA
jgi:lipoprotein-anchoring transpeptidase ErfK/SrfK